MIFETYKFCGRGSDKSQNGSQQVDTFPQMEQVITDES